MAHHHSKQPLAEETILLPHNHFLNKLFHLGIALGFFGLIGFGALHLSYERFWTPIDPAHHGDHGDDHGKKGHKAHKKGHKAHNKGHKADHKHGKAHKKHDKAHAPKARAGHDKKKPMYMEAFAPAARRPAPAKREAAKKDAKPHAKGKHDKKHAKKGHAKKKHSKGAHHQAKAHPVAFQPQIWGSYLVAFFFFLTISLGAFMFILIHFATNAGWSVTTRRLAEFIVGALPFMALLFIPLYIWGKDTIWYNWLVVADSADALVKHKRSFLNLNFFTIRAVFYFSFWVLVATWYARKSMLQDKTGDEKLSHKMRTYSYLSIFFFAWTVTFAGFDWIMSIDPHWYSTIFGVYIFAGCIISVHSFIAIFVVLARWTGLLKGVITTEHQHDIGKMMYAFNIFWTYIGFSQFMLIWYGNIPEETMWYAYRINGQWSTLSLCLAAGHFVVPFFFLMSRHIKRNDLMLLLNAFWLLGMHLVDIYWLIMPTLYNVHGRNVVFQWIDLLPLAVAFVAIGGFFLAGFGMWMRNNYLIPRKDPRLEESLAHQNF